MNKNTFWESHMKPMMLLFCLSNLPLLNMMDNPLLKKDIKCKDDKHPSSGTTLLIGH